MALDAANGSEERATQLGRSLVAGLRIRPELDGEQREGHRQEEPCANSSAEAHPSRTTPETAGHGGEGANEHLRPDGRLRAHHRPLRLGGDNPRPALEAAERGPLVRHSSLGRNTQYPTLNGARVSLLTVTITGHLQFGPW